MDRLRQDERVPPGLASYLLPQEDIVVAAHQHWAKVGEPVATTALALVGALWIDATLTAGTRSVGTVVWLAFLLVVCRLAWRLLEWRHDWFVATDKRLLLRHGLITRKVSMMPLVKVTDMSYERSLLGQLLGYGRFVMESAGQDQALRVVNWVARPDETYQAICGEIFSMAGGEGDTDDGYTGDGEGDDAHSDDGGAGRWQPSGPVHRRRGPDTGPLPAPPG